MSEEQKEESFAEFEAKVLSGEAIEDAEPEAKEKPEPKPDDEALDLTEDDDAAGDEGDDTEEGKRRHKSAKQRIGELTAKTRAAERERDDFKARLAALEAKATPEDKPAEAKAPDPNDEKYEFGEADPKYIADLVRHEINAKSADEAKAKDEDVRKARAAEVGAELDGKWQEAQAAGAEKYDDFADKIGSLKIKEPMLAVAIQASPVAADAAYHLAQNPHEAALIEARIAAGDLLGAAERFGEIEGATLEEAPVAPTNGNPLDIALHAGRLRTFNAREAKPKGKIATDAPEPAKHAVRGGAGKFEVADDTDDFAAFERKHMRSGR